MQRALAKAREQLDEDAFRRAQDEGRRMSVKDALRIWGERRANSGSDSAPLAQ